MNDATFTLFGLRTNLQRKSEDLDLAQREHEKRCRELDERASDFAGVQRLFAAGQEVRAQRDKIIASMAEIMGHRDQAATRVRTLKRAVEDLTYQAQKSPPSFADAIVADLLGKRTDALKLAERAVVLQGKTITLWDGSQVVNG